MTIITLELIKAEQTRLAALIAQFEAQPAKEREQIHFPEVLIDLAPGEHYAGLIVGKDGEPSYHLVLVPGQSDEVTFEAANEWAGLQGYMSKAGLPTRREQALLYANLKEQFEEHAYWSCEAHEAESGWAWYLHFYHGGQNDCHKSHELRARAVRRLIIPSFIDFISMATHTSLPLSSRLRSDRHSHRFRREHAAARFTPIGSESPAIASGSPS